MKEERDSGDRERVMRASLGKEKGEIIKKRQWGNKMYRLDKLHRKIMRKKERNKRKRME